MKSLFFLFSFLVVNVIFSQDNPVFLVDAALVAKWKIEEITVNGKPLTEHQELDEWNITADKRYVMSRLSSDQTIKGRWEIKYESVFVFYPDESSETPHFEVQKIHPLYMIIHYDDEGDNVVFKLVRK